MFGTFSDKFYKRIRGYDASLGEKDCQHYTLTFEDDTKLKPAAENSN